jgi:hypothetical protein
MGLLELPGHISAPGFRKNETVCLGQTTSEGVRTEMKKLSIVTMILCLQGCATAFAVADVAGATVVYAGKTVVNTIDAITPDIVNKKK